MDYQDFIGKTVKEITAPEINADEGFTIIFTDNSKITVGFSGDEGTVILNINYI